MLLLLDVYAVACWCLCYLRSAKEVFVEKEEPLMVILMFEKTDCGLWIFALFLSIKSWQTSDFTANHIIVFSSSTSTSELGRQ